jgi:transaldolase/glucose-6-phosphate isomerase
MVYSCGPNVPPGENPGVGLGIVLGALAKQGRDKITLIASPAIADIGAWLEQLLAESTGKLGKGLIPLEGEPIGAPQAYGTDRLFVYLRLDDAPDASQDAGVSRLEEAGQPVVRIAVGNRIAIGQEFIRWEIATAVAGAIIGINPFDQPDVEASKIKTRELMSAYERGGTPPAEIALFDADGIKIFADANNAKALKPAGGGSVLVGALRAHFARLRAGDYCALLAYVARNASHRRMLQDIRAAIRDAKHVATCVGFGPRFLHSTGQAYKGGPNSGVVLQITSDHAFDLSVPGRTYSFGAVIDATAQGDFAVLNERGRRAIRVHLGSDVEAGLARLRDAIGEALKG